MHTFTDTEGLTWVIQLDTNRTRAIRSELGVDLLKLDETSMSLLIDDDEKLVDVISFICDEQIERKGLDENGFARLLVGGVIDDACDALMAELVFISRRNRAAIVAKAWQKTKAAEELMTAKAIQILDSGVIEEKVNQEIRKMEEQLGMSLVSVPQS